MTSKPPPVGEELPGDILITGRKVQSRIKELGRRITDDYLGKSPMLICVLNGAAPFLTDLVQAIDLPTDVDYVTAVSYGQGTQSSGTVRLTRDVSAPLFGRDIVLVEDIVDTGLTVHSLIQRFNPLQPRSMRVCSLLSKRRTRLYPVAIDYVGFEIPDRFVFGYGLDLSGRYRDLREIRVLE